MGPCKVTGKEFQGHKHGRSLNLVVRFIRMKEMLHLWRCRGWAGSISNCPDVLPNPPVYSRFWEQAGCLSNCPTYFLGFSRSVLGPPLIQFLSGIFWGMVPLSYPIIFAGFHLESSHLWSPLCLLLHMAQSSAPSFGCCACT